MFQEASFDQLVGRQDVIWIDVRSPGEFLESTIPGAMNIPLFTDDERAHVGTAYKQVSPEQAKAIGLEIVSAKLPQLIKGVQQVSKGRLPVIFCSRGGMRSKTMATLVDLMGTQVVRLEGGYRAYRNYVLERLAGYQLTGRFVMLHGLTGVGKTEVIEQLIRLKEPAIDLEQLAHHRGSAFGGLGLNPINQRRFDSELLIALDEVQGAPYVIMEAESKRIGRVQLPDFLLTGRETAIHLQLVADIPTRVERILSQYVVDDPDFRSAVAGALRAIEKRLSPEDQAFLWEAWEHNRWPEFVATLLTTYYDPLYLHSSAKYQVEFIVLDASSINDCVQKIRELLQEAAVAIS